MGDGEDLLKRVWDENADPRATTSRVTAMAKGLHASDDGDGDGDGDGGAGDGDEDG
jgi:hypothetical protein